MSVEELDRLSQVRDKPWSMDDDRLLSYLNPDCARPVRYMVQTTSNA
jgi:hypothetical protein